MLDLLRRERLAQIKVSGFPSADAEVQYNYISKALNVRFMEFHISHVRCDKRSRVLFRFLY